jgi:hypothetical protein
MRYSLNCIYIERRRLSETSCRKLELIDCYESAKLPVYVPKKKVEAQPLIRSLRSASPGAESGFPKGTLVPKLRPTALPFNNISDW